MDPSWEEHEAGEIHIRDIWQFELKSEFSPLSMQKQSEYTQEFFIFIPDALQINTYTYRKENFFRDETNLIRFKTPQLSFEGLLDPSNKLSPLARLWALQPEISREAVARTVESELKLFASIFRKTLRRSVSALTQALHQTLNPQETAGLALSDRPFNSKYSKGRS